MSESIQSPPPAVRDQAPVPAAVHPFLGYALRQRGFAVSVVLVVLFGYFAFTQENFFTSANIKVLLTSASILWVVAIGLTFVMLTGGIDLSVGSMLALSGVGLGAFYDLGFPVWLACVSALAIGLVYGGIVNGLLIGAARLPFLVVTLGSLILVQGLANLWSDTQTVQVTSSFLDGLAFGSIAGVPNPVWLMIGVLGLAMYVQRMTYFGRDVYVLGSNPEAARLSGVRIVGTTAAVYAIAGLAAALGGMIEVGRLGASSPMVGGEVLFTATAAVLLGGTSLKGGSGGVGGTAVGVLLIATLENGLAVSGLASAWQQIFTGAILVSALGVDVLSRQRLQSLRLIR